MVIMGVRTKYEVEGDYFPGRGGHEQVGDGIPTVSRHRTVAGVGFGEFQLASPETEIRKWLEMHGGHVKSERSWWF